LRSRFALAVVLALTFFARPSVVEAPKTGNVARVGFLYFGSREPGLGAARYAAFLEGLRDLGYVEGKGLILEARFAESALSLATSSPANPSLKRRCGRLARKLVGHCPAIGSEWSASCIAGHERSALTSF